MCSMPGVVAFKRQSRQFRIEAKQSKRQLVQTFLQDAHHCCLKQDPAQWYQRIRCLCRANRREGIHLRGPSDDLLSPHESIQALREFFSDLFTDRDYQPEPLPPLNHVPFTKEELCHAIAKLPIRQAAVPTVAPTIVWKDHCASTCGSHVQNPAGVLVCGNGPCLLPAAWHAATACLLPKPGKAPKRPGNLRPISIQHPACKILTGLAADRRRLKNPPCLSNSHATDTSLPDPLRIAYLKCSGIVPAARINLAVDPKLLSREDCRSVLICRVLSTR